MVPDGWQVNTLSDSGVVVIDGDRGKEYPKSEDFSMSGYCLFLNAKNVTKDGFKFDDIMFISQEKHKALRKGIVKKGDLVLTTRGSIGHFAFFNEDVPFEVLRINSGMVILDTSKANVCSEFLFALSKSYFLAKQINRASFGSAQPQLTVKIIDGLKIPIPPHEEQTKIAQILSTWDKAIATVEQLIENSQQQKKALMQQLLTGNVRLSGCSSAWIEYRIGEMGDVVSGGTPDTNMQEYWGGGIQWVTPTDVTSLSNRYISNTSRQITSQGLSNSSANLMPEGSLLICTRATIGFMCISKSEITTNQGFKNIVPNHQFNVEFLYYLLNFYKYQLIRYACGSTFLELSKKDFMRLTFICPDIEEQKKIAAILSSADKDIEALKDKLALLKQEKKSLMQQLLTGKRRVTVDAAEMSV